MKSRNLMRRRVLTAGIAGLIAAAGAAESASASTRRSRANAVNAASPGMDVNRVVRGRASFTFADGLTTIRASNRAIIDYDSFNIPAGTTVRFIQPNSKSTVLNRIVGSDPSHIDGRLISNGIVWIVNPAGVMFGPKAVVNVGGIYAAAGNISNDDFRRGLARFQNVQGDIINEGSINARTAAHLIGDSVSNTGSIVATRGVVTLTSGRDVFLSEKGANLMVRVDSPYAEGEVVERTDGAGVDNSGSVEGRDVVFTAGDLYSVAIKHSGSARSEGGSVRMETSGTLVSTGSIDVSDLRGGHSGGRVRIVGSNIEMQSGLVDASGDAGGGTVHIGGERHGRGGATATTTNIGEDVVVRADAVTNGDGGEVVVWADDIARYHGNISARGGAQGGDGGFVEVSGAERLMFRGDVDTAAPKGKTGNLLLDPKNIQIGGGGGQAPSGSNSDFDDIPDQDVTISVNDLENLLDPNAGSVTNVTLQANNDILVVGNVNTVGGTNDPDGALTLQAGRSIIMGGDIRTDGNLTFVANDSNAIAANRDAGAGQIKVGFQTNNQNNATNVTIEGRTISFTIDGTGGASFVAGDVTLGGGNGTSITGQTITVNTPEGVIIGAGSITADNALNIHASGGNIAFSAAGRVLNTDNLTLRAGDGSGATARVDFTNAPMIHGAAGGATLPDTVTIRQDASIVASTDLLAIANFGDGSGIGGLDYRLQSDGGSITFDNGAGAAKVAKANLTTDSDGAFTVNTTLDLASLDATGSSVDINAAIEGTEGGDSGITLESGAGITIGGALTGGANGVTLLSGQSVNGNISFDAAAIAISGGSISFTAGNGSTNSQVDFTNAPTLSGLTAYTHQQDAAIGAASVLSSANFTGGLANVDYALTSLTGSLTIDNAANLNGVKSLALGAANNVTVDVPITVTNGFSSSGANFDNTTGGSITAGTITFDHTGSVTLMNNQNTTITGSQIGGPLALDVTGDASVTVSSGDLDLGASTVTGALNATADNGAISLSDTVNVTGAVSFTANGVASNADGITLGSNRLQSPSAIALHTTGNATVERDGAGVTLAASTVGGDLTVTHTGGVGAIQSFAVVDVAGDATLTTAGGAGPFDVAFSDLRVDGAIQVSSPGDVGISAGAGDINFGASTLGGDLIVQSLVGSVTDSGTVQMTSGASELRVQANSVNMNTLDTAGSIQLTTTGNATVANAGAISLLASNIGGNLSVSAGAGGVQDNGAISVGGNASFNADNGTGFVSIDQTTLTDATKSVSINTQGTADYTTAGAIQFGTVSVGDDFTVNAADVNFVGGANSVSAKNAGVDVFLLPDSAATNIGVGAVTGGFDLSATDLTALANGFDSVTIGRVDSAGLLTIGTSTFRDPVLLRAPGAGSTVSVNGTVSGSATGTSITIEGAPGASVNIGGVIQTNAGAITINHDLNLTGSTTLSSVFSGGAGANITALRVDAPLAVGAFNVNAGSGGVSLVDTGPSGTIGSSTLTGNAFINIGDVTAGTVTLVSNGTVDADTLTSLTGALSVTGGDVAVESLTGATSVTIEADTLASLMSLTTTGAVTVRPHTPSTDMGVGVAVGGLDLTGGVFNAIFGQAGSGYSSLTLGRANGTGTVTIGANGTPVNLYDSTTVLAGGAGGEIVLDGGLNMDAASSITLNASQTTLNAGITGAGSNITLIGPATVATDLSLASSGATINVGAMNATGASDLTLNAGVGGTVLLGGNLGTGGSFGQLNVTAPTIGLASNVNVNANGANFGGAINSSGGARALNVAVGAGGAEFASTIGAGSALSSMSVTGKTDALGSSVTTTGDQTWGDVDVTNATTLTTLGGVVRFTGDFVAPGAVIVSGNGFIQNASVVSTGAGVTFGEALTVAAGDAMISSLTGSVIDSNITGGGNLTVDGALSFFGTAMNLGDLDLNGALSFTSNALNITTTGAADFASITGPGLASVLTINAGDTTTGATFGGNVGNVGVLHSTGKSTIAAASLAANSLMFDGDVDLATSTTLTPGAMPSDGVFFGGDVTPNFNSLTMTIDGRTVANTGTGSQRIEADNLVLNGGLVIDGTGDLSLFARNAMALEGVTGGGSNDLDLNTPLATLNGNISGVDALVFNTMGMGAGQVTSNSSSITANTIDFNTQYRSNVNMALNANSVNFGANADGLGVLTINADTVIDGAGATLGFSNVVFNGALDAGNAGVTDLTITGGLATFTEGVGQTGAFDSLRVVSSLGLDADAIAINASTVDLNVINSSLAHNANLTINANNLTIGATVGGGIPLGSLVANVSGTSTILAPVTTNGAQSYFSPVILAGDSIITASSAEFGGAINGAFNLDINATSTTFGGAIGQSTALASLQTSGATTFADPTVTTTGLQSYGDALLGDDAHFTGASVAFNGTVDSTDALTPRNLLVDAAAINLGGDMNVDNVRFDGAVNLTDDVQIFAAGDEGIFFNGTVDGAHSLTLLTDRSVLTPIFNAIAGGDGKLDATELDQFRQAILNRLLDGRPLPVISFGGDVGGNVALTQLNLNPDGIPTALNPSGLREIPAVWATVVGGARGGDGSLTLDPNFTLNITASEFMMGVNEKFTVLGSMNINAATSATIGDLTIAKNLAINSPNIALQARNIGYLIAPLEQKKQQVENDLGILDGYSNDVTDRIDIVAGGSIMFSSAPDHPAPDQLPVGQSIKAFIAGKQYNQINNNPNNIALEFLQIGEAGFPISDLVIEFNTNNRAGLGDVPGFDPLLVGGSTIQLVLDIPHEGLVVANPPITPVVIVNTGVGIVEEQVLVSQSVRERLERIGVSARDASAAEMAEASRGRTLYNDYADDTLASDSVGQYNGEIVVNRLPARVAERVVDQFDDIVGPNDERLNSFLDSLAEAYLVYQDEAPDELFDDPRLLAAGFAASLNAEQAGSDLELNIQRIAQLLNDIERLGVTRFEYERSLQTVLATFTPDPDMSLEEFRTVVDWYRDRLAAAPANVLTPQDAMDTPATDDAASES